MDGDIECHGGIPAFEVFVAAGGSAALRRWQWRRRCPHRRRPIILAGAVESQPIMHISCAVAPVKTGIQPRANVMTVRRIVANIAAEDLKAASLAIGYGPAAEPSGVRRLFMRDPFGRLINILSHE
nr:hypothetical protein [Jiella mangrovi]